MVKVNINLYKLVEDKKLSDLTTIPSSDEVDLIKTEGDLCFFMHKAGKVTTLFWSHVSDVIFIKESCVFLNKEELSKRNKYINGEFV